MSRAARLGAFFIIAFALDGAYTSEYHRLESICTRCWMESDLPGISRPAIYAFYGLGGAAAALSIGLFIGDGVTSRPNPSAPNAAFLLPTRF